jgi:hypothetical protein
MTEITANTSHLNLLTEHSVTRGISFDSILHIIYNLYFMDLSANGLNPNTKKASQYENLLKKHLDQLLVVTTSFTVEEREAFLLFWFAHISGARGIIEERKDPLSKQPKKTLLLLKELKKLEKNLLATEKQLKNIIGTSAASHYFNRNLIELSRKLSGVDAAVVNAKQEILHFGTSPSKKRGPQQPPAKGGYVGGGKLELDKATKGRVIGKIQPLCEDLIEQPNRDEAYEYSTLRLLADGYYLAGIKKKYCKERHLRKVWNDFKKVMGDDLEMFTNTPSSTS